MDVVAKFLDTLGAYSEGDVRSMLKDDHKIIRELAEELVDAKSAPARRSVLTKLKPFLTAHARAEEQAVYTPLANLSKSADSRASGNEGAVEHSLVDVVMGRMEATHDASTDMWKAHAKVLHELLEHHIKEEESQIFEELGEHFSPDERAEMGAKFLQLKEQRLKRKSPSSGRKATATVAANA